MEESSAPLEFCCEEPLISQSKKEMGYTIANQKKTYLLYLGKI